MVGGGAQRPTQPENMKRKQLFVGPGRRVLAGGHVIKEKWKTIQT